MPIRAHPHSFPLTPGHSRACWCKNIVGRMTKAKSTSSSKYQQHHYLCRYFPQNVCIETFILPSSSSLSSSSFGEKYISSSHALYCSLLSESEPEQFTAYTNIHVPVSLTQSWIRSSMHITPTLSLLSTVFTQRTEVIIRWNWNPKSKKLAHLWHMQATLSLLYLH